MFILGFSHILSVFDILVFLCIITEWGRTVALKGGIKAEDLRKSLMPLLQKTKGNPTGIRVKAVTVTTEERTHILPVQSNGKPSQTDIDKLMREIENHTKQQKSAGKTIKTTNSNKNKMPNVNSINKSMFENLISQLSNAEMDYLTKAANSLQSAVSNSPPSKHNYLDLLQLIAGNVVRNNKLAKEIKQDSAKLKNVISIRQTAIKEPKLAFVSRDRSQGQSTVMTGHQTNAVRNIAERIATDSLPLGITPYRTKEDGDRVVLSQKDHKNRFNTIDIPESYKVRNSRHDIGRERNLRHSEPPHYLSSNKERIISPLKDRKTDLRQLEMVGSNNFVEGNQRNTARRLSLRNQGLPDIQSESFMNRDVASIKEVRKTNTMEKTPHREYVHSSIQTNTWISPNDRHQQSRHSSPQVDQFISPTRLLSARPSDGNQQPDTSLMYSSNTLPEVFHETPDMFRKDQPSHYTKHSQRTVETVKYNGKEGDVRSRIPTSVIRQSSFPEKRLHESQNTHSVPLQRNLLRPRSEGSIPTTGMNNEQFIERKRYSERGSSHSPSVGRWSTLSETGRKRLIQARERNTRRNDPQINTIVVKNSHPQNRQVPSGSGRSTPFQQPSQRRSELLLKSVNQYEPTITRIANIPTLQRIPNYHSESPSKSESSSFKLSRNQKHQFDNVVTNQHYESLHPLGNFENTPPKHHRANNVQHLTRIPQIDIHPTQPQLPTSIRGSYDQAAPTSRTRGTHHNSRVHSISPLHAEVHNVLKRLESSTKTNSNINEKAVHNTNAVYRSKIVDHGKMGSTGTSRPAMAFQKKMQVIENTPQPREQVVSLANKHQSALPMQSVNIHQSRIQKQDLTRPIPVTKLISNVESQIVKSSILTSIPTLRSHQFTKTHQPKIPGLKYLSKTPDIQHKVASQAIEYPPHEGTSQNQLMHANVQSYSQQHSNTVQQHVTPNVHTLNLESMNGNFKQTSSRGLRTKSIRPAMKIDTLPYQLYQSPSVTQNQAPSEHKPLLSNTQQPQIRLLLPSNKQKTQQVQQSGSYMHHNTREIPSHSSTPQQQLQGRRNHPNIQPLTTNQQNMSPETYQYNIQSPKTAHNHQLHPQLIHQQNQIQSMQTSQQLQTGQQNQILHPQIIQNSYIQPPQTRQQKDVQHPQITQHHESHIHQTAKQHQIQPPQTAQQHQIQHTQTAQQHQIQPPQTVQHHQIQPPQTAQQHQIQHPQTAQQIQHPQTAQHQQVQPPQTAQQHQIQHPQTAQQIQHPQTVQHHQIQPPQTAQQHQIQHPQTAQQHQIQPPQTAQQHQIQHTQTAQQHQIQPPQTVQHHQIQPPQTAQQHQIQHPQTAQQHQIQPPQTAQQIQPPQTAQQHQIQPPQTVQHHQIQPSQTAPHHKIQPKQAAQQYQIQPPLTSQQIQPQQYNQKYQIQPQQTSQQTIYPPQSNIPYKMQPAQTAQYQIQPLPTNRHQQIQPPHPRRQYHLQSPQTAPHIHPPQTAPYIQPPQTAPHIQAPQTALHIQPPQTASHIQPPQTASHIQPPLTNQRYQIQPQPANKQHIQPQIKSQQYQMRPSQTAQQQIQPPKTTHIQAPQTAHIQAPQTTSHIQAPQIASHIQAPQIVPHIQPPQPAPQIQPPQTTNNHAPQTTSHIQALQTTQNIQAPQTASHIQPPLTNQRYQIQPQQPANKQIQSQIKSQQYQMRPSPAAQQQIQVLQTPPQQIQLPQTAKLQIKLPQTVQQHHTLIPQTGQAYQIQPSVINAHTLPPVITQQQPAQASKNQQQYKPPPSLTNQQLYQPPPSSTNQQQYQPPPSTTNQKQNQPSPSSTNQQQNQPSTSTTNQQQYHPPPSTTNQQQYQSPPSSIRQQKKQPSPSSTNQQQYQPPPLSTNQQQNQPPPSTTNQQQNQPPPSTSNKQQYQPPPSTTNQQQNQPPPSNTNKQHNQSPPSYTSQQQYQPPPSTTNQKQNQPPPYSTNHQQYQPPPSYTSQQQYQPPPSSTNQQQNQPPPSTTSQKQNQPPPSYTSQQQQHQQHPSSSNQQQHQSPPSYTSQQQYQQHPSYTSQQQHQQQPSSTNQQQNQPPPSTTNQKQNQPPPSYTSQQQNQQHPSSTNQQQHQSAPSFTSQQKHQQHPPSTNQQQHKPSPSSTNQQQYQPPPSSTNQQQYKPPPSSTNQQQYQPPPSSTNQQHNQPPPSTINQQHNQPPPSTTNQQHNQPPPSTTNQQHNQPPPSTTNLQHNQPPPSTTNQKHNQPPPSTTNQQQYQPPPSTTNQQQNQPPPSSTSQQQNQPPPYSTNQQHNQQLPSTTNQQQHQPLSSSSNQHHKYEVSAFTNNRKMINTNHASHQTPTFIKSSHQNQAPRSITNKLNFPTVNTNQQQIMTPTSASNQMQHAPLDLTNKQHQIQPSVTNKGTINSHHPLNHQIYQKEAHKLSVRPNKVIPTPTHVSVDIKPSNKFVNFQFTVNAQPEQQNADHNGSLNSSVPSASGNTATNKHTQGYNFPTSSHFKHNTHRHPGKSQASRISGKQPAEVILEVSPSPHDVLFQVSVKEHHSGQQANPTQLQTSSHTSSSTSLGNAAQHKSHMQTPYNIL